MPANVWEMNYSTRHFRALHPEGMLAGVFLHLSDALPTTLNKSTAIRQHNSEPFVKRGRVSLLFGPKDLGNQLAGETVAKAPGIV